MNNDYVYRKRLLKLANFLDELPPKRFDFARWVGNNWKGKPDLSCGTTACALGWATTIPAFRKIGLRLVQNPDSSSAYRFIIALKDDKVLDQSVSFQLACKHAFDLSPEESKFLFTPHASLDGETTNGLTNYASTKQVSEHIRKFVRNKYSLIKE